MDASLYVLAKSGYISFQDKSGYPLETIHANPTTSNNFWVVPFCNFIQNDPNQNNEQIVT